MSELPHRPGALAAVALAGAVAAAGALATGCSQSQVSGCRDVALAVRDTHVQRVTDDLTLTATLTADGRPVAGQQVNFWLYDKGPGLPPGSGVYVGTKSTGAAGQARLNLVGGPARALTAGSTPTGFGAEIPQGKHYCAANTRAALVCGPSAPPVCPAVRPPVP